MPSKKRKNGAYRDIAHPLNNETRRWLEETIIKSYKETVSETGEDDSTPVRCLSEHDESPAESDDELNAEEQKGQPQWP